MFDSSDFDFTVIIKIIYFLIFSGEKFPSFSKSFFKIEKIRSTAMEVKGQFRNYNKYLDLYGFV